MKFHQTQICTSERKTIIHRISSKRHKEGEFANYSTMDFERIFIKWGYVKIIINEASEAGRDYVNPPKGGILIV